MGGLVFFVCGCIAYMLYSIVMPLCSERGCTTGSDHSDFPTILTISHVVKRIRKQQVNYLT